MLGRDGPETLPRHATDLLVQGYDSPSLRQLAGMGGEEADRITEVFQDVLRELGLHRPNAREAAMRLSVEVARAIASGSITPDRGAREIWSIVRSVPKEQLPELDTFVYGASEWDERPEARDAFAKGIISAAHDLLKQASAERFEQ